MSEKKERFMRTLSEYHASGFDIEIRNRFIEENYAFIRWVVIDIVGPASDMIDDYTNDAILCIIPKLKFIDPTNVGCVSWLRRGIRTEVMHKIRELQPVSMSINAPPRIRYATKIINKFIGEHGYIPSVDQVRALSGKGYTGKAAIRYALDTIDGARVDVDKLENIGVDDTTIADSDRRDTFVAACEIIATFPERTQRILKERYIEGRTLQDISAGLDVTRERVRQIQEHTLQVIRKKMVNHIK